MTLTSFLILITLTLLLILIYVELGSLPGKKARERGHPQADAINVLAWIGLLLGGAPWLVALVWAYMRPLNFVAAPTTTPLDQPASGEDDEHVTAQ